MPYSTWGVAFKAEMGRAVSIYQYAHFSALFKPLSHIGVGASPLVDTNAQIFNTVIRNMTDAGLVASSSRNKEHEINGRKVTDEFS